MGSDPFSVAAAHLAPYDVAMAHFPLRIGLTGGIGSGKSTAAAHFARLGVPVIDTDEIARELVEPGTEGFDAVLAAFGRGILTVDGVIDRAALRRLVFAEEARRLHLESLLHPLIRQEVRRRVNTTSSPYCIIAIPLLIETGQADLVDRVLVIDVPEDVQRQRAAARPGWSVEDVDRVMRSQAGREARLRAADEVILNDADVAALQGEVERLHARYLELARKRGRAPA
jgi:dephospho-CoA kinase